MRSRPMLSLLLACASAPAQQFVTNGDFSAGMTGWTETGYNCSSGVQSYDVDGLGPSQSFFCMPGGQVTPPPYAPNTLEQSVLVVPTIEYEFSCDLAIYRPSTVANADAGTVTVEIGGVEIARRAFGAYAGNGEIKRAKLCTRFTTTLVGQQTLKLNFSRTFLCSSTSPTPFTALDNVSLRFAIGPTFCLQGNLKIGTTVSAVAFGPAAAPFAIFVAPSVLPSGLTIPSFAGQLWLDPATMVPLFTGKFDANGQWSMPLLVPNDLGLTLAPTWLQGAHLVPPSGAIGFHHAYVFVR